MHLQHDVPNLQRHNMMVCVCDRVVVPSTTLHPPPLPTAPANRSVEESFMIINSSTAALKPGAHPPPTRVALAPVFAALERICAVAEDDTRMQQPLCLDCSDKVQRELESQVREVRAEVHRYEATLAELDGQGGGEQHPGVLPEEEFAKQLAEAQAEEAKQRYGVDKDNSA